MNLSSGTRLGPYEILSPIGAGGMGEVFRARDTRLERSVAIKILPASLAHDAQFRLRLEREAKTISQLNHPHICTLYDVGQENGTHYLVMELIEGESLADRLSRGALPVDQVLRYGAQIAGALDRAHRQGIVHRDLKPGNIMITRSGAKLLDFGLAKATSTQTILSQASALGMTEQKPITEQGTIVGTYQYMAPEQLEGLDADARTDIFALGTVLYEMATGKRAFEGKTRTSLIAAIVSSEPPPISLIQPLTPPALEHVIRKCLAKDPDDRWQSAHDVAAELQWIAASGSQAGLAAPIVSSRRSRERLWWIAALLLTAGLTAAIMSARRPQQVAGVNYRFEVPSVAADHRFGVGPRLSPDGRNILYGAENTAGDTQLMIRRLDETKARVVEGSSPLGSAWGFSPDGRQIAFVSAGHLRRAPAEGGASQVIAKAGGRGLAYGDGFILIGNVLGGIKKVSIADGRIDTITKPDGKHAVGHAFPYLLPGGDHFLYSTFGPHPQGPDHHNVYVGSVQGGEPTLLGDFPSAVEYGAGYLFYVRDGVAMARRFDPKTLVVSGDPITVAENVRVHAVIGHMAVSAAADGTLAVQALPRPHELVVLNERGERLRTIGERARFDSPLRLTPDGEQVLTARTDPKSGTADIVAYGINRPTVSRLTFEISTDFHPVMSRDGSRLFYATDKLGVPDIYERAVDGGEPKLLLQAPADQNPMDVSPVAPLLLYLTTERGNADLAILPLDGRAPYPIVSTPAADREGRFSPDGEMIVYQSSVSGRQEVYVRPATPQGVARQISTSGGKLPRWSHDGRMIYFISTDEHSLLAAPRSGDRWAEATVQFTHERKIFAFEPLPTSGFIVMEQDPILGSEPIRIIVRWPETL